MDTRHQKLERGGRRPPVQSHAQLHMELEASLGQIQETLSQTNVKLKRNVKLKGRRTRDMGQDICYH